MDLTLLIWLAVAAVLAFALGFALACLWLGVRQRAARQALESEWQRRLDAAGREIAMLTRMCEETDSRSSTLQQRLDMTEAELLRGHDRVA